MEIEEFPGCCCALVISNWKGFEPKITEWGYNPKTLRRDLKTSVPYAEWALKRLLACCDSQQISWNHTGYRGHEYDNLCNFAFIFATLRTDQKHAIEFARTVGFTVSEPVTKGMHNDGMTMVALTITGTDLQSWWKSNKGKK